MTSFLPSLSDAGLSWFCEPPHHRVENERLIVEPDAGTDFWQRTHYGFRADNGHFLHRAARGNFVLTTKVRGFPRHQYDQAGLMLRVSQDCWLKTSVEWEPDEPYSRLGAVVTNGGFSDWSTQPVEKTRDTFWFRIRAETNAVVVDSSFDGVRWEQIRMAHLAERSALSDVQCGLYACSPKTAGFRAEFQFLDFDATP